MGLKPGQHPSSSTPRHHRSDQAFGIRERTETMHSILDALLPFKVLQRWGKASKSGFVYGYLIGHNLLARQALLNGLSHLLHPDS